MAAPRIPWKEKELAGLPEAKAIAEAGLNVKQSAVCALIEIFCGVRQVSKRTETVVLGDKNYPIIVDSLLNSASPLGGFARAMLTKIKRLDPLYLARAFGALSVKTSLHYRSQRYIQPLVRSLEIYCENHEPDDALITALGNLVEADPWAGNAEDRRLRQRVMSVFEKIKKTSNDSTDRDSVLNLNDIPSGRDEALALLRQLLTTFQRIPSKFEELAGQSAVRSVLQAPANVQIEFVHCCTSLLVASELESNDSELGALEEYRDLLQLPGNPKIATLVVALLLRNGLVLNSEHIATIFSEIPKAGSIWLIELPHLPELVKSVENLMATGALGAKARFSIRNFLEQWTQIHGTAEKKLKKRLAVVVDKGIAEILQKGEAWSNAALTDLADCTPDESVSWVELLRHCGSADGGHPSTKWRTVAESNIKRIGGPQIRGRLLGWFPLVDKPRTQPIEVWNREWQPDPNQLIIEPHADILKGLAWCCGLLEDKELARALTALALSSYRKVPKIGPRLVKVGNACVTALGMMPGMEGVYQLALLKVKVKFGTAQKVIEKALNAAAERVKIPRADLEEMAVPAYGLTDIGVCEEPMGEFTARLTVTGGGTEIGWVKADGKVQKGVPAAVKQDFAEELKELKAAAKDIERMLPAQKERIDNLFLQQKSWPFAIWQERYLDHPLVGVIARRLLWVFTTGGKAVTGIWFDGRLVDVDLQPVATLPETTVELWHPIGRDLAEVMGWRGWLDTQQIQQPFKQAHREVYLLTDAERNTRTYSNRFAGHVLKQHQFNALCAARGWKNKLRLMVDAEFPPASKLLPQWGLRAEYWIEGAGDEYGRDTNETGTFLYLTTDQVRFYPVEAVQRTAHAGGGGYHSGYQQTDDEPMPLEQIPALVLSEILRDVDLFVGVSSVGNDPNWADGGPTGRYADYWQGYSFGDLGATARTRKEVLERLVPRLKIAKQCSFDDKFLVVKGSVRTYKIHLGSGNILMEPNDQYLCIVPGQGKAEDGKLQLPFEGDRTLSIIISKAFLLAADDRIEDPTILSQIGRA